MNQEAFSSPLKGYSKMNLIKSFGFCLYAHDWLKKVLVIAISDPQAAFLKTVDQYVL